MVVAVGAVGRLACRPQTGQAKRATLGITEAIMLRARPAEVEDRADESAIGTNENSGLVRHHWPQGADQRAADSRGTLNARFVATAG
ncbi:hypothetical protein NPS01_43240 [Nocardioides psychrotolerans]|nr:hypothetical protein NPS01_43240 [Nocardioides psychrotolerans]